MTIQKWEVTLIKAGQSKNDNYYSSVVLEKSVSLFEGLPALVRNENDHLDDKNLSVRAIVGWFDNVKFQDDSLVATFHILRSAEWLSEIISDAWERGHKNIIGFSVNAIGVGRLDETDNKKIRVVEEITAVKSIDVVVNPSAGGRILNIYEPLTTEQTIEQKLAKMMRRVAGILEAGNAEVDPKVADEFIEALELFEQAKKLKEGK